MQEEEIIFSKHIITNTILATKYGRLPEKGICLSKLVTWLSMLH